MCVCLCVCLCVCERVCVCEHVCGGCIVSVWCSPRLVNPSGTHTCVFSSCCFEWKRSRRNVLPSHFIFPSALLFSLPVSMAPCCSVLLLLSLLSLCPCLSFSRASCFQAFVSGQATLVKTDLLGRQVIQFMCAQSHTHTHTHTCMQAGRHPDFVFSQKK